MRKSKVSIFIGATTLFVLSTIFTVKAIIKTKGWLTEKKQQRFVDRQEELRGHQTC
jgi:hypothetical protein